MDRKVIFEKLNEIFEDVLEGRRTLRKGIRTACRRTDACSGFLQDTRKIQPLL